MRAYRFLIAILYSTIVSVGGQPPSQPFAAKHRGRQDKIVPLLSAITSHYDGNLEGSKSALPHLSSCWDSVPSRPFLVDGFNCTLELTSNNTILAILRDTATYLAAVFLALVSSPSLKKPVILQSFLRRISVINPLMAPLLGPNIVLESQRYPSKPQTLETLCANDATVHLNSNRSRHRLLLRNTALFRFSQHIHNLNSLNLRIPRTDITKSASNIIWRPWSRIEQSPFRVNTAGNRLLGFLGLTS